MEILELNKTRLKIRHRPIASWIAGGLISGAALIGLVYLAGWLPVRTRLTCDRNPIFVTCQLQQQTLLGVSHRSTLKDVQTAGLERCYRSRRSVSVIVLSSATRSLEVSNSERRPETIAEVQTFLSDPTAARLELRYAEPGSSLVMLIFMPLFLGLGISLLRTPFVICTFYRTLHRLVIEQQRLGQKQEIEYALNNILLINLEEVRTRRGKGYRVILRLADGKQQPLTADLIFSHSHVTTIADTIRSFLQLP